MYVAGDEILVESLHQDALKLAFNHVVIEL
jgi:hypothetical protein